MSLKKFTDCRVFSSSAIQGISLSLGAAMLLSASGAVASRGSQIPSTDEHPATQISIAQIQIDPSRVRIPDEPDEAEAPSEERIAGTRFSCEQKNDDYIVMYHPASQPGESYEWAKPSTLGGGWTPERRCGEISRRLESYRPDGLQELRTGIENGYDIVCVTTQKNPSCRIVLTVPPGEDPTAIRNRVFENLTVADSGQQTEAANAIVDTGQNPNVLRQVEDIIGVDLPTGGGNHSLGRSSAIDLRPFLDPADGGTGTLLNGGRPNSSSRQLNPENFR